MSVQQPPHAPVAPPAPAPAALRCPRCGATVAPEQDWCLECGAPARTRLAPTPNWRLPVALIAAIVLAAGVALAIAFAALTHEDATVTVQTAPATAPVQPNETAPDTPAGSSLPGAPGVIGASSGTPASTATPPSTTTPPATGAPAAP